MDVDYSMVVFLTITVGLNAAKQEGQTQAQQKQTQKAAHFQHLRNFPSRWAPPTHLLHRSQNRPSLQAPQRSTAGSAIDKEE